jgi:hypothetical protein
MDEHFSATIKLLQSIYPTAILTGTCALLLYGFDLKREPTDIDFIIPSIIDPIPEQWQPVQMPENFQAKCYSFNFNGIRVECIMWYEPYFQTIDGIRVGSLYNIISAKKDLGLTGTKKHLIDFENMLIQLLEERKTYIPAND